jgi:uncharacterized protein with GYD domain
MAKGNECRIATNCAEHSSPSNKATAALVVGMKLVEDKAPKSIKDGHTGRIQEIRKELNEMEVEFHELNVQQIREEAKDG